MAQNPNVQNMRDVARKRTWRQETSSEVENPSAFGRVGVVAVLRSLAYIVERNMAEERKMARCVVPNPTPGRIEHHRTVLFGPAKAIVRLTRVPLGVPPWRPV